MHRCRKGLSLEFSRIFLIAGPNRLSDQFRGAAVQQIDNSNDLFPEALDVIGGQVEKIRCRAEVFLIFLRSSNPYLTMK